MTHFIFTFMTQIPTCHNLDNVLLDTMIFMVMIRKLKDLSIALKRS